MNPSNADMAYEDITGFNLLEPTILNYHTRATASDLGNITSPKLNDAGKALFNTSNGIVTAGLKIQHPEKLEPFPTVKDKNETANTVALQAKTAASTVAEGKVTSDYALIQPQKAYLEALYWRLKPHYAGLGASNTRMGDERVFLQLSTSVQLLLMLLLRFTFMTHLRRLWLIQLVQLSNFTITAQRVLILQATSDSTCW